MLNFQDSIIKGHQGELIFKADFLDFLHINYKDVTGCQQFQIIDTDFLTQIGTYEIKLNYKDNKDLIFEDYTNINETLAPLSMGWVYKTKADLIIFISRNTRVMIFLPYTESFKKHYETIKSTFKLRWNQISVGNNGNQWQSAFRVIPFSALHGYISVYKKI